MSIKRLNPDYSGGIPEAVGDRYYAQDLGRDFHSILDFQSRMMKAIVNLTPQLLRGGTLSKGTNYDDLDVTAAFGIVGHSVETPDDFSSLPPTVQSEDIDAIIVESPAQVNYDLSATATLNGSSTNYVKLRYKEADGASRNRAKKSGSYVYEKEPSYEIVVNTTAPTAYDCLLGTLVGDGTSFLTITQELPYFFYTKAVSTNNTFDVGNCMDIHINAVVTSDITITLSDGNINGQRVTIRSLGSYLTYVRGSGTLTSGRKSGIWDGGSSTGTPISTGRIMTLEWSESLGIWLVPDMITADYQYTNQRILQSTNGDLQIILTLSGATDTSVANIWGSTSGTTYYYNFFASFHVPFTANPEYLTGVLLNGIAIRVGTALTTNYSCLVHSSVSGQTVNATVSFAGKF